MVNVSAGPGLGAGDCLDPFIPPRLMHQVVLATAGVVAYTGKGIAGQRVYYRDEMLPPAYSTDEASARRVLTDCGALRVVTAVDATQVSAQVTLAGKAGLAADTASEPSSALPKQALMVGSSCILPVN